MLTSVAAIVPFYFLCRELKLRAAEINLALLLMAVNWYMVSHVQEVRMYSLLLFLTLCSLWLFVRFFKAEDKARKPLLALTALNLLLVYTQYYGWLVVGTQLIILLFWGRRKLPSFAVSVAVLFLCFSPWALAVTRAAVNKGGLNENLAWNRKPRLVDLVTYYGYLNGALNFRWSTLLRVLLFGCPVLLWAWHVIRDGRDEDKDRSITFWWLTLLSFPPIALAFFVSQVLPHSVWAYRYLIIVAVPYTLLVAVAVLRLRPAWIRNVAVSVIVGWAVVSGFKDLSNPYRFSWEALVNKMVQAELASTDAVRVYVTQNGSGGAIKFYLGPAGERKFEVLQVKNSAEMVGAHFWVGGFGNQPDHKIGCVPLDLRRIGHGLR